MNRSQYSHVLHVNLVVLNATSMEIDIQVGQQSMEQQQQQHPTPSPVLSSTISANISCSTEHLKKKLRISSMSTSFPAGETPATTNSTTGTTGDLLIGEHFNFIMDLEILFELLTLVGKCPKCNIVINTTHDLKSKRGLCHLFVIVCGNDKCTWS